MNRCSLIPGMKRRRRGFTLVETLVALVISVILISMISSMVLSSASATSAIHSRLAAFHDANLALDYLAQDFASLVPANLKLGTMSIYPEKVTGGQAGDTASSVWIMLLSHPASAQQTTASSGIYQNQGAISAVSYRLAYQDPVLSNGPYKSFALYRSVVPLPPTSGAVAPSRYLSQANPTDFHDFWLTFWGTYSTNNNPPLSDYLLGDVVNIQVTLNYSYLANSTDTNLTLMSVQLQNPVDWTFSTSTAAPGASTGFAGNDLVAAANVAGANPGANVPISIDVSLTILRAHGALMYQKGAWTLQQAIQQEGVTVSRNLPIQTNSPD